MCKKVLAIDPGERVGWAHGVIEWPMPENGPRLRITGHGISFLKDFALALNHSAETYDVFVFETWRLRAAMAKRFAGSDFPAVQLIGMVRLLAWTNNVRLVPQGPDTKATAEKTASEEVKRIIAGLPGTHDEAHDGDALLHLWHYYWKAYV